MSILVFAQAQNGKLQTASQELLTLAHKTKGDFGGKVIAVLFGKEVQGVAQSCAEYGATDILSVNMPDHVHSVALTLCDLIKTSQAQAVLASACAFTKELMPQVAVLLNTGMVSDCVELTCAQGVFTALRPVFSGKCFEKVQIPDARPQIFTVRPNVFEIIKNPTQASVQDVAPVVSNLGVLKEVKTQSSSRPDLVGAEVVVSAGRSIKAAENFKMIEDLADVLGAAVGASRAAVDAGYASHSIQVGQTGKTVNPKLYIACGISGAIQHLAGMSSSKVIVAINTDKEAPIFQKADYGLVGDMFEVVPKLTQALKNLLTQ